MFPLLAGACSHWGRIINRGKERLMALRHVQIEHLKTSNTDVVGEAIYRSEVREAKELSIKWHKAASAKDDQIIYL